MTQLFEVDGRSVQISRPDKVLFPDDGVTKADLARYYSRVGQTMIPHLRDRALTMHRFPDGIGAEGFFQKAAPEHFPDWIERRALAKEDGEVAHVVANDVATLVYLADQGCITLHVTLSRLDRPDHPDRMIFDMDPPEESEDLGRLRESVEKVKAVLDDLALTSFLMTTGSKGYHILVPVDRSDDFDTVRRFARDVSELCSKSEPELLTTAHRKSKRGDRVFVDYLRNGYAQTGVAPYAIRALAGAPVATPLDWDELSGSEPRQYTMDNIFRRLGQRDDPWADLGGRTGQSLGMARRRVDEMIASEGNG